MIDLHINARYFNTENPANLRRFSLIVALAILCVPISLSAQGIGEASVQLIDGNSFTCEIDSIDEQGNVTGQNIPEGFNITQAVSVQTKRTVSKSPSQVTVYPVGGGEIYATQLNVREESLTCTNSANGTIALPLQSIRAVVWSSSDGVKSTIGSPSKDNDQIVVQVADGERTVGGILESVDKEFLRVNFKNESRKIGLAKVKAFVVADLDLKPPAGSMATIQLVDGSRCIGVIAGMADGELNLNATGGATLKIKADKIVQVAIVSDRLAYLSDLEPTSVDEKSVFAIQLPWRRDKSAGNNPIRLNSGQLGKPVELRKGIGMQSFSQLSFVNNEFDRFRSVVGIDAETAGRGDCQMVVRGDGIELWSKRVKATDQPIQVDLDIAGIKQISLIVYPGEDFDLGDHADWGEARFLKTR